MNQSQRVILHVFCSTSWGGAEIYSLKLAQTQMEAGENVIFWAPKSSPLASHAQKIGLTLVTEKLGRRIDIGFARQRRILKSYAVTHLHLHWSGGLWSLGLACWGLNIRKFLHVHLWLKHSKRDPLHAFLYSRLNGVIVAGNRAKEAALECLPIVDQQVVLCPYAIEIRPDNHLEVEVERENTLDNNGSRPPIQRKDLGWHDNDFVMGFFARLDRQKGAMELLQAFSKAQTQFRDLRLLIVGDPTMSENDSISYRNELTQFAKKNLLPESYQFHGFQDNFRDYLRLCDVMALPSYHESYSLMILEAFYLGIPVLSTAAGGTPDLVSNERGWLAEPQNSHSLLVCIEQIMKERHQIPSKGLMAQNYVLSQHNFRNVLQILDEAYGV